MKTNSVPFSDQPSGATPDNTRVGNFWGNDDIANGYDDGYAVTGSTSYSVTQNYLTDVGAYTSSPSYYATFDQGGNVFEWNEAVVTSSSRGVRGGCWSCDSRQLHASSSRDNDPALDGSYEIGFRVASIANVPEPSTAVLAASIVALFACRYRRRPTTSPHAR